MPGQTPTIFESFNARTLTPWQVAETFVPSEHFERLAKRRHTLVVGPRGSGKTTLLKMLQQPALERWRHSEAPAYRDRVDFTGVFVGTDVSWGAQIDALGDGHLEARTHELLGRAAFTTHVLRALTKAMLFRLGRGVPLAQTPYRRVSLTNAEEASMVRAVADAWRIRPNIASLLSLKHALSARLSVVRELASREARNARPDELGTSENERFLDLHFVQSAAFATELFDDLTGESESKWALLFDELELAPEWIRTELVRSLRSTEDRFLFKLALSPYADDLTLPVASQSPNAGDDYDEIALWYAERRDGLKFCESLWDGMLANKQIQQLDPREVLGRSYFETPPEEWIGSGTAYRRGSRLGNRIARYAQVDRSFAKYLADRDIDPERLEELPPDARAGLIRKVAPIIPVREFYRRPDTSEDDIGKGRSRKNVSLYSGAESLFAITEGNPRWFIAIVGELLT